MSYVGNKPAQTTIPVDDSVTTAMLKDDAVTADKVANAINTSIAANTAKVTNATHTGDVTGATALTIATDAVDIAMLSATGTADATTFLRGDNAWAEAGGGKLLQFVSIDLGVTSSSYGAVTWEDTYFTGTITPTASDSKILIYMNTIQGNNASAGTTIAKYRVVRTVSASDTILSGDWPSDRHYYSYDPLVITLFDAPATTSEITYMLQTQRTGSAGGGNTGYLNSTGSNQSLYFMEIGA